MITSTPRDLLYGKQQINDSTGINANNAFL